MAEVTVPTLARRISTGSGIALTVVAVLVLSLVLAVSVGAVAIPPSTVWGVALDRLAPGIVTPDWSIGHGNIVWEIRFPRVILAGLVGAGLGLVGAALQSVTRNPLADPHLLGISSGGAFGAIAALLHTGMFLGLLTVPLMAFGGALFATMLVLGVAQFAGASSADRLVLAGVAVSFVIMACANILIFLGDPRATHTVVFWMLGGLGLAQWSNLVWPFAVLVPCGLTFFVVCALITGVMVAFSGLIGFVGLMMPHLVRLLVGGDNARVMPASALAGAVFLIWADALARVAVAPEDMPIGVVTGLIGGLFFIWMMARRR
jgi:iron complex transport system permease protein